MLTVRHSFSDVTRMINVLNFRKMGGPTRRGAIFAWVGLFSDTAVLDQRSQHVVFQVQAQGPGAEDQDWSSLARNVPRSGTVPEF